MGRGRLDGRRARDAGRASVRILLVCPYDWEAPGGVQVHVRQLAAELRARGHRTTILAPGSRPSEDAGVRIVGRPVRVPYRGTVAPISFSPGSWRRIRSAMRSFDPDVIHAHEPLTPSTSMLAVLAASAPVVATFHAFARSLQADGARRAGAASVSGRIDAAVAVSDAAASFLRRVVRVPLEIVPNGVDVRAFAHPGRPSRAPGRPGSSGRTGSIRRRGSRCMLRAFEQLASELGDAHLLVAGDGRDRVLLRSLPRELRSRILRLGTVPHAELPRYHAAARRLRVARDRAGELRDRARRGDGGRRARGGASDIAGYREVVRDGVDGLLVPPKDPDALAAAIRAGPVRARARRVAEGRGAFAGRDVLLAGRRARASRPSTIGSSAPRARMPPCPPGCGSWSSRRPGGARRHLDLQPAGQAPRPREQRVVPDRRPAATPVRPDPEPGDDGSGVRHARAGAVRARDGGAVPGDRCARACRTRRRPRTRSRGASASCSRSRRTTPT